MSKQRSSWWGDLTFGARLAIAGGREGMLRTALAAIGVGLGVALLLVCVSVPNVLAQRHHRGDNRDYLAFGGPTLAAADNTMLISEVSTEYHDAPIRGILVQPEGAHAPVPPGLSSLPGAGDIVASPALADLLASKGGALLRDRFPGRVVGTIGVDGLAGPNELAYYLGSATLSPDHNATRIDHFGESDSGEGLDPVLLLLVVVIFVVLLLPIGTFVAAAVRFGGERRDRRLAAIRLVGADAAMARRIAAGEALLSAAAGLVLGVAFFLIGRQLIENITLQNLSVFATDVRPSPTLTVLIAVAVPVAAVAITVLSLRRVVIEPLGVVRQGRAIRRRLWWRLAVPLAGLMLLYPLLGDISKTGSTFNTYQVGAGVTLLLLGTASLLPWLVQAVVRRLGGGGVSWQLATRRLQLDPNTSARAVTGIAVAAAGSIALQMLFSAAGSGYQRDTGQDPNRAQIQTVLYLRGASYDPATVSQAMLNVPGVDSGVSFISAYLTMPPARDRTDDSTTVVRVTIGGCAELAQLTTSPTCVDGDTFIAPAVSEDTMTTPVNVTPGLALGFGEADNSAELAKLPQWSVPADVHEAKARRDPSGQYFQGIFLTPKAAAAAATSAGAALPLTDVTTYLNTDRADPEVVERVRNAAARIDPTMGVYTLQRLVTVGRFADIQRGLFVGAFATLLLIGASLIVSMVEQLRDRRRLLAALVAFGTKRSTLSWSILWQAMIPVALGVILATIAGGGLGALLLRMVSVPVSFDWQIIVGVCGTAAAVVALVTVLSLPALWRLMRPEGLRTE